MKTLNTSELTDFSIMLSDLTGKGLEVSHFTYTELGTFGIRYTLDGKQVFAGPYRSKSRISCPKDVADAVASIVLNKKLHSGVVLLP